MKSWKPLPLNKLTQKLGEKGQTIVEFVLLLAVVTGISFGFVAIMNKNLARYWEYSANLIVNDKPGGPKAVNLQ